MTKEAAEARREYKRQWAKRNPEKIRAQQARYWSKRAAAQKAQAADHEEAPAADHEPESK